MTTSTPAASEKPASPNPGAFSRWRDLTPLGILITRCEVALAGLFLYAAYHKLWGKGAAQNFSDSVKAFHVFDQEFAVRMATSVTPWVEVVASIVLIVGVWTRAAASVLGLMLVMFIILIARAITNHYDLECGCFGDLSPFCPKKVSSCNIVQNVILLAMALTVALTPRHRLVRAARPV